MSTKRKHSISVILILVMVFAFTAIAPNADSTNVKVRVNGQSVAFNNSLGHPFINDNDRTMIPFRAVANFMTDVEVLWDDNCKEASFWKDAPVTIYGEQYYLMIAARFPIGTNQAWRDIWLYDSDDNLVASYSHFTQMDTLSYIVNDRTYAPIRYLAEALFCLVGWDDSTRTVLIYEPTDIAEALLDYENNHPEHFVTWDYEARQYAYIYLRRVFGYFDPNLEYLGEKYGYLEGDERGWLFNSVETGHMIYIYVNDEGETWFSDDGQTFHIWE